MFIFDRWAMHADSRQALYFVGNESIEMVFIDNSHLFGGPDWWGGNSYQGGGGRMIERFAVEEWDKGEQF